MKRRGKIVITGVVLMIASLMWGITAQAQSRCSVSMARGTYAVDCNGHATLGQGDGAMLLPAIALGTASLDGEGNVTDGFLNVSVGGMSGSRQIMGGSGEVNPDCTGTIEISLEGLPSATVPGVMLDQGNKILAFSPIPGTTAQCTLTRISLD